MDFMKTIIKQFQTSNINNENTKENCEITKTFDEVKENVSDVSEMSPLLTSDNSSLDIGRESTELIDFENIKDIREEHIVHRNTSSKESNFLEFKPESNSNQTSDEIIIEDILITDYLEISMNPNEVISSLDSSDDEVCFLCTDENKIFKELDKVLTNSNEAQELEQVLRNSEKFQDKNERKGEVLDISENDISEALNEDIIDLDKLEENSKEAQELEQVLRNSEEFQDKNETKGEEVLNISENDISEALNEDIIVLDKLEDLFSSLEDLEITMSPDETKITSNEETKSSNANKESVTKLRQFRKPRNNFITDASKVLSTSTSNQHDATLTTENKGSIYSEMVYDIVSSSNVNLPKADTRVLTNLTIPREDTVDNSIDKESVANKLVAITSHDLEKVNEDFNLEQSLDSKDERNTIKKDPFDILKDSADLGKVNAELNLEKSVGTKYDQNTFRDISNKDEAKLIGTPSNEQLNETRVEEIRPVSETESHTNNESIVMNVAPKDKVQDDDQCEGYHSSDFEFITESDAEKEGLIVNITFKTYEKKVKRNIRRKKVSNKPGTCSKLANKSKSRDERREDSHDLAKVNAELNLGKSIGTKCEQNTSNKHVPATAHIISNEDETKLIGPPLNVQQNETLVKEIRPVSETVTHIDNDSTVMNAAPKEKIEDDDPCEGYHSSDFEFESDAEKEGLIVITTFKTYGKKVKRNIRRKKVSNKPGGCSKLANESKCRAEESFYSTEKRGGENELQYKQNVQLSEPGTSKINDVAQNTPKKTLKLDERHSNDNINAGNDHNNNSAIENKPYTQNNTKTNEEQNTTNPATIKTNESASNKYNAKNYIPNYYQDNSNHVVPEGEEYLNLFRGIYAPMYANICFLENKSVRPQTCMNIQYEGLGFDLRMPRHDDDDQYKQEAEENLQKILEMYPQENRSRRKRRRRF